MNNKKSIFNSWPRFYHYVYHRLFGHKIIWEFTETAYRGWRGDHWCKYCGYYNMASCAMRMEKFGLYYVADGENSGSKFKDRIKSLLK